MNINKDKDFENAVRIIAKVIVFTRLSWVFLVVTTLIAYILKFQFVKEATMIITISWVFTKILTEGYMSLSYSLLKNKDHN